MLILSFQIFLENLFQSLTSINDIQFFIIPNSGARVIMACRSEERGMAALREIQNLTGASDAQIKFMKLDLSSLKSVRQFVAEFKNSECIVCVFFFYQFKEMIRPLVYGMLTSFISRYSIFV